MNRVKLFVENFYLFGVINMLHKVIPFLILPVLTLLLPDISDFGVFDMFNVVSSIVCLFAMLGLYNAVFREYFEREDQIYRHNVTSTAYHLVSYSSVAFCILIFIFQGYLRRFFPENINITHITLLLVSLIFTSVNLEYFRLLARVLNQRKVILISGLMTAGLDKVVAIILILFGYRYYGLIYGLLISNIITMVYFWSVNSKNIICGRFDKHIAKSLLKLGLPLLPVTLFVTLNFSVNRFFILRYLDFDAIGVYSIGARVAMISNFIYLAFHMGWGYFTFSTMKDDDFKEMMSKLFSLLFAGCTAFYVGIFLFKDIIFNYLFTGKYSLGVSVFPFLLFIPLLQIFILVLEFQLLAKKKPYYSPFIHGTGFVVNIVLCMILIPRFGIIGAALATLSGFTIIFLLFLILVVIIKKHIVVSINTWLILVLFVVLFFIINYIGLNMYSIALILSYLSIITLLYHKQVIYFWKKM